MGSCADDAPITFSGMLDEEVVLYAKNGSDRAVDYLLQKYRSLVESKARLYFLVGADHDDVVQEGMIGLYKAIRDFRDDKSKFRAFAELCVTRQIITAIKTDGKIAAVHQDSNPGQAFIEGAPKGTVDPRHPERGTIVVKPAPADTGKVWSLVVWAAMDLGCELEGVPPYLSRTAQEWFDPGR